MGDSTLLKRTTVKPNLPLLVAALAAIICTAASAAPTYQFRQHATGLTVPASPVPPEPAAPAAPVTPSAIGDGVSKAGACASGVTGCATWSATAQVGTSLSADALTATVASGSTNYASATRGISIGKWYWEVKVGGSSPLIGMLSSAFPATAGVSLYSSPTYLYGSYTNGGTSYRALCHGKADTTGTSTYSVRSGDTIGYAADRTAGTLTMYRNGTLAGVICSNLSDTAFPVVSNGGGGAHVFTVNFGQADFKYPVPAGYNAGLW